MDSQEQNNNSWDELVSAGLVAREGNDKTQWVLGDLAMQVQTGYGKDAIGKYAADINVNKESLRRYRVVSAAFPPELRLSYLSYSHHRLVAGREDRVEILEMAHDNNWSVEALQMHLKKLDMSIPAKVKLTHIAVTLEQLERVIKWGSSYITFGADKSPVDEELLEKMRQRLVKVQSIPDSILQPIEPSQ